MMFTKKEMILLTVFGSEDTIRTKRSLSMAALLAEDAAAQKALGKLVQHFSAEVKKGLDCELAIEQIREEVQPRLMVSLTVFDEKTDDYIHVYPIRQLAKCLLMKAYACDAVADTIDKLERLQTLISDKWFSSIVKELLEDLYNIWANGHWMYEEVRDSSIAVAGAVEWLCTAPDVPKKTLHLPKKNRGTATA